MDTVVMDTVVMDGSEHKLEHKDSNETPRFRTLLTRTVL